MDHECRHHYRSPDDTGQLNISHLRRFVILLIAVAGLARAQNGLDLSPAFEVASTKPSGHDSVRGSDGGRGSKDPGRYFRH
jgi:hypothetical protein